MAKTVVMVLGVVFILIGILGFFNNPVLGLFEVDTVHNWIHILSGIVGVAMASMGEASAKTFAKVFGVVYGLVTVVGFIQGDTVLGLFSINMADNVLHLLLTVALLYVGFMGSSRQMSGSSM